MAYADNFQNSRNRYGSASFPMEGFGVGASPGGFDKSIFGQRAGTPTGGMFTGALNNPSPNRAKQLPSNPMPSLLNNLHSAGRPQTGFGAGVATTMDGREMRSDGTVQGMRPGRSGPPTAIMGAMYGGQRPGPGTTETFEGQPMRVPGDYMEGIREERQEAIDKIMEEQQGGESREEMRKRRQKEREQEARVRPVDPSIWKPPLSMTDPYGWLAEKERMDGDSDRPGGGFRPQLPGGGAGNFPPGWGGAPSSGGPQRPQKPNYGDRYSPDYDEEVARWRLAMKKWDKGEDTGGFHPDFPAPVSKIGVVLSKDWPDELKSAAYPYWLKKKYMAMKNPPQWKPGGPGFSGSRNRPGRPNLTFEQFLQGATPGWLHANDPAVNQRPPMVPYRNR